MEKTNEEVAKEMAKNVSSFINNIGCDGRTFVEAMAWEHRTLQQNFTRLCVSWLELLSKNPYGYDLRNEASYQLAKKFVERLGVDERSLPFF